MPASTQQRFSCVLTVACPGKIGTVAAVSGFLADHHCDIIQMQQYYEVDFPGQGFFMRIEFQTDPHKSPAPDELRKTFAQSAAVFDLDWAIYDTALKPRVLIMVSKFDHCLADLLYRWKMGELDMDVVAVVSNHPDLEPLAAEHGIPFHHLPVTPQTKPAQEARLLEIVAETDTDLVVLARYMQVLTNELCERFRHRAINIHHSFLPSFKGAKPYHQAHDRGVKLIGATAHYVTGDLDEGPIIEQSVGRVNHTYGPNQLVAMGRDMEKQALASAVKFHIEHRVFVIGNKTVVFE